jgi:hypothetical protein
MRAQGLFAGVLIGAAVAASGLPACDPGSLNDGPVTLDDGGVFLCEQEKASSGTGYHNPGQGCLTAGCHRQGSGPEFTIGGTLYVDRDGNAPVAGATIVVIDGDGQELELVTADNGNFYTNLPVRMPLYLRASKCPSDIAMVSLAQSGDCNSGSCHGPQQNRVWVDD